MHMKLLHLLSLLGLQIVKTNEISYAKEKVYQLVDLDNFEFKINSGQCGNNDIQLVVLVHSAVNNKQKRNVIRETWGRSSIKKEGDIRVAFMLAQPNTRGEQEAVLGEYLDHRDIVQGSFIDSYKNLTYKHTMGLLWATEFCPQAHFILKTDDDMFLDLYEIHYFVNRKINTEEYTNGKFLVCPVFENMTIEKNDDSKWFVDKSASQLLDEDDKIYPPYCSGWLYVTNRKTATSILKAALKTPFFWIDDVWVTGYLAAKIGIHHIDIARFFTPSSRRFIFSKLLQSRHTLNHDYMVGPQQGEDMGVARLVQWWAEWCQGRCHNTIYTEGAVTPPGYRDLMMFVDNRFNVL